MRASKLNGFFYSWRLPEALPSQHDTGQQALAVFDKRTCIYGHRNLQDIAFYPGTGLQGRAGAVLAVVEPCRDDSVWTLCRSLRLFQRAGKTEQPDGEQNGDGGEACHGVKSHRRILRIKNPG